MRQDLDGPDTTTTGAAAERGVSAATGRTRTAEREPAPGAAGHREAAATASAGSAVPRSGRGGARALQLLLITAGAVAVYVGMRLLPTGTNLNHMDFRAQGGSTVEFCDPAAPQFVRVTEARSPVSARVATALPAAQGRPVEAVLSLRTASGKPVGPEDLLVVHTQRLHLMAVDPTLTDYQHLHPQPGDAAGEWRFAFTPRAEGTYRLFADFTPVATTRGLYASTDLQVAAAAGAGAVSARHGMSDRTPRQTVERDGYRFTLRPARPLRVGEPVDFTFEITRASGGAVPLEPVMGAYAHLVAFDVERSGFAHLHPMQADPLARPDAIHPAMAFNLTVKAAGPYVIWTQVNLAGTETFVPFWMTFAAGDEPRVRRAGVNQSD
ncbi:hypothetical protein [Opitutus sp. ER46]|uniref:hypothetical protein n=1 Tax=Opitutus sp. ER46 TaxID=2161864 RepID=UPI000D31B992|nr:hypothetical protein [Opitutus sp. ER46]PTX96375.1 hypothetical protein DB354_06840 [Opitutus sp. ER46]